MERWETAKEAEERRERERRAARWAERFNRSATRERPVAE
jgi:hypothetical protein